MKQSASHWQPETLTTRNAGDRVIKTLGVKLEIKANFELREIEAYASVFDVLDRQGDIVVKGAFKKSIKAKGGKVKVLYQHDTHRLIGHTIHLEEDSKGLLTVMRISDVPDGDLALKLAADGSLDRMSIGFEVVKSKEFEDDVLRAQLTGWARGFPMHKLTELDLWEVSPVTFAANDEADILAVRSAGGLWVGMAYKGEPLQDDEPDDTQAEDVNEESVSEPDATPETEVTAEPAEDVTDEQPDDDVDDDTVCATCGKGVAVLSTDIPAEPVYDYSYEAGLIETLRGFSAVHTGTENG